MLAETLSLSEDHTEAITGTAAKLKLLRRGLPSHRRWAIRIDLAEFAKGYVADERKSLMAFVAKQVTSQGYTRKLDEITTAVISNLFSDMAAGWRRDHAQSRVS
jgi:hypothetical protein